MKQLEKTVFFAGNNLVRQAGEPPRHYYTAATASVLVVQLQTSELRGSSRCCQLIPLSDVATV